MRLWIGDYFDVTLDIVFDNKTKGNVAKPKGFQSINVVDGILKIKEQYYLLFRKKHS